MTRLLLGVLIGVIATLAVGVVVFAVADLDVVERNQVTVPQVVGLSPGAARDEVESVGLSANVFNKPGRYDNPFSLDYPAGGPKIVAQSPEPGFQVEEGTTVGLDAGGG